MMKNQLAGLMKQAQAMQEKMQQQMGKINEELASLEVEGQSGAGMVKLKRLVRSESSACRSRNPAPGIWP